MGIALSVMRGERVPGARWLVRDSLLAQALTLYEASLHACGHPVWESMDPANEGHWVAPLPMRCHACTAVTQQVKNYEKADAPEALMFRVERRQDPPQPSRPPQG